MLISALIKIVPEFVMDGNEIRVTNLNAHLDAEIVLLSMSHALAWQTTSRSAGLVNSERSQKVFGNGAKPSEV